jgi:hypothetical protein
MAKFIIRNGEPGRQLIRSKTGNAVCDCRGKVNDLMACVKLSSSRVNCNPPGMGSKEQQLIVAQLRCARKGIQNL